MHNWKSRKKLGFQTGTSTITTIDPLTKRIKQRLQLKAYTECVLLDIKGEFDNIWHDAIFNNLSIKWYPAYLITLISNYLQERYSLPLLPFLATLEHRSGRSGVTQPSSWSSNSSLR